MSATGLTGLHGAYRFAPVRALYARSSAVLFCMALVGCGSAPLATFDLSAPRSGISSRTVGAQVIVTEPVAVAPLAQRSAAQRARRGSAPKCTPKATS